MAARETVSIMDAVALVRVSRRTIYNWIAAGRIEFVRTAGGSVRIFTDTLWRGADGAPLRQGVTPVPMDEERKRAIAQRTA